MHYIELQVTTNFSFLRGASHPDEFVEQASIYGYDKIAITDRNSFAGIVRAHVATRKKEIKIIPACHLDLLDGHLAAGGVDASVAAGAVVVAIVAAAGGGGGQGEQCEGQGGQAHG